MALLWSLMFKHVRSAKSHGNSCFPSRVRTTKTRTLLCNVTLTIRKKLTNVHRGRFYAIFEAHFVSH